MQSHAVECMRDDTFSYRRTVYLTDTNAEGNVYFARYFDWQGETREAYLKSGISADEYRAIVVSKTRMVTVNARMDYFKMLQLFDAVRIKLNTRNIKKASLELVFSFYNENGDILVAEGCQQLAFQNRRGRLIPVPTPIQRIALAIELRSQQVSSALPEGR